jgi:alkylation response protein AidB-like acyl-CoA dehydrogenase
MLTSGAKLDKLGQDAHGGYGYINEYAIARMYRNSHVQRIYGGSSEIMKVLIASVELNAEVAIAAATGLRHQARFH